MSDKSDLEFSSGDIYWAADSSDAVAHTLDGKFNEWKQEIVNNRMKRKWLKSYYMYFGRHWKEGADLDDTEIMRVGDEGELKAITINHYRNLIKHILVLTTNQKPAFDVRAINADHESLQQAKLANNILEAYLKDKKLRRYVRGAAEQALVFGKGFLKLTWEPTLGRPVAPETYVDDQGQTRERVVYEGDIEISNPSVFDVYCDQSQEDWTKNEWIMVRSYRNKYSLAVRYPHLRDQLLQLPSKSELDGRKVITLQNIDDTSDVPVYEFFHKRTDALPNGRYLLFCNGETVLYDGPIPYESLPVFRITPGEVFGTTEGYSDAFDLMGIQQALNVLASTIFSNESTFGVQSILVPEGANVSHTQLSKGMAAISYNPNAGKIEPLQLTSTPEEIFKFMEMLERMMETISGVNSVARGNPENSLHSGVALGLVQSMAVQFASAFQESYAELLEDAGTFIIELLKDFATTERMITMAGRWSKGVLKSFTNKDLMNVRNVVVELGNPMARTTAGRIGIADNLLERGLISTPQEYVTVMETGQLDPLLKAEESQLSLIHKENDDLADGKEVPILQTDKHLLHMKEHNVLLDDPYIRANSAVAGIIMAHIQQHAQMYQTQSPMMLMVTGEPPPPPPPMPPGMMPPPGGPGGPPPGHGGPPPPGHPPGPPGPGPGGPPPPPPGAGPAPIKPGSMPLSQALAAPTNQTGDKRTQAIIPTQFGG